MPKSLYSGRNAVLAATLVEARRAVGLRQTELARRLSRDQSAISNIENGQRRIDLVEFHEYALALGIDPRELFGRLVDAWSAAASQRP